MCYMTNTHTHTHTYALQCIAYNNMTLLIEQDLQLRHLKKKQYRFNYSEYYVALVYTIYVYRLSIFKVDVKLPSYFIDYFMFYLDFRGLSILFFCNYLCYIYSAVFLLLFNLKCPSVYKYGCTTYYPKFYFMFYLHVSFILYLIYNVSQCIHYFILYSFVISCIFYLQFVSCTVVLLILFFIYLPGMYITLNCV